eukprot:11498824-Alexandrium_andersonii.AAC.1
MASNASSAPGKASPEDASEDRDLNEGDKSGGAFETLESVDALKNAKKLLYDGPSELANVNIQIADDGSHYLTNITETEM